MTNKVQVVSSHTKEGQSILSNMGRPKVNKKTGEVFIANSRGLMINSTLRKDEWEELDRRIYQAALQPLNIVQDVMDAGLTRRLGGLGTLTSQWNIASEMTRADVSLTGRAQGERDHVDLQLSGVPVPIIFKEFELDLRTMEASRRLGDGLDTTNAELAARVVSEEHERIIIDGNSNVVLNGDSIAGLTSETNRNTGSAVGDFGTISNIVPTIENMITAANGDGYYGPFNLYVYTTQFNEMALSRYSDGSGQSPLEFVRNMPMINDVKANNWLAAGEVVLVQMTSDVIDIAFVPQFFPQTTVEWTTGDGMTTVFKVMSVGVPRVKSDYNDNSGVVHFTGA